MHNNMKDTLQVLLDMNDGVELDIICKSVRNTLLNGDKMPIPTLAWNCGASQDELLSALNQAMERFIESCPIEEELNLQKSINISHVSQILYILTADIILSGYRIDILNETEEQVKARFFLTRILKWPVISTRREFRGLVMATDYLAQAGTKAPENRQPLMRYLTVNYNRESLPYRYSCLRAFVGVIFRHASRLCMRAIAEVPEEASVGVILSALADYMYRIA